MICDLCRIETREVYNLTISLFIDCHYIEEALSKDLCEDCYNKLKEYLEI